jgi:hypothetical protein
VVFILVLFYNIIHVYILYTAIPLLAFCVCVLHMSIHIYVYIYIYTVICVVLLLLSCVIGLLWFNYVFCLYTYISILLVYAL